MKTPTKGKKGRLSVLLPIFPLLFLATYLWAAWYYGDVLRMARERSFWVAATGQMDFLLSQEYGGLWYVGRMLLTTFRHPWLGALLMATLITVGTWCVGYDMRLKPRWRFIQYLPAGAFIFWIGYEGVNFFHNNETGMLLGIPFCVVLILLIWAVMIRSFSRKKAPAILGIPHDETPRDNLAQLLVIILIFASHIAYMHLERPYVRVIASQQVGIVEHDWQRIMRVARDNAELSYRPIAAAYAVALVQTGQICERMYDIRLDYDSMYVHGPSGVYDPGLTLYLEDCDYYAGLIQPCLHHAMERITMIGPNIHSLELLTKCHLMRGEWDVARKYLRILRDVPFEGSFVEKYSAMVENTELIDKDPEMAVVRLTEPIHDSFENSYVPPIFLGYNAQLSEGRSINALHNSLAVCLYTKMMPSFVMRTQPMAGTTPPENVADALCLMSSKTPEIASQFPSLVYRQDLLASFLRQESDKIQATQALSSAQNREQHARQLFSKYKGYYPYYYFFGNLKATRQTNPSRSSSSAGVN